MSLVSNYRRERLSILLWFVFLINLPFIAAQTKGIIEHTKDLTHDLFIDTHHQLNQIGGSITNLTVSCVFNKSLCSYRIIPDVVSQNVTWSLTANNFTNTQHSKENYVALVGIGKEGARSFLQSLSFQTTPKERVEFFYYLSGDNAGQLQVKFIQANIKTDHQFWSDSEDHGAELNYGCMELPPNRTGYLLFTGILGPNTESVMAVQKVFISQGSCEHNVQMSLCTFDNTLLCNYTLACTGASEYVWKRYKGATPTFGTGPNGDAAKSFNGFYLYAESSYGSDGDSAIVNFPVGNTTGRYLHFWYHMYGKSMGSLRLRYHVGQLSKEEWAVSGNQGDKWKYFCLRIVNNIDAFSLVAVHGSSYLGDIAIDNVRVDDQNCPYMSLDCNFSTPLICGYRISSGWSRVMDANGFKMSVNASTSKYSLKSAIVNITDSCVRLQYQMRGSSCNLTIFENQQKLFTLLQSNESIWASAQFYIKQARVQLKFDAYSTNMCEISIANVSTIYGSCPALECPKRMKGCSDRHFCVNKKQVCDLQKDCKDGSDEICPKTIACDFEYPNNCGYYGKRDQYERYEQSNGKSDYHIILFSRDTNWTSPWQRVNDSCVQFSYNGRSFPSVEIFVFYDNKRTGARVWKTHINQAKHSWSPGQFFITAGTVQLVFNIKGQYMSQIGLDNILLITGSCPPLGCSKDHVPCAKNNKCIKKRDICNRIDDCMDMSDEMNCSLSIDCNFEHPYLCGYQFSSGWVVTTGRKDFMPRHDQTKGTYYGQYMLQRLLNSPLTSPEIMLKNITCLRFYYYLQEDVSAFNVYDNNVDRLQIKSNNIQTWQMAQLQLSAGKHKISFSQTRQLYRTTLAIDSVSTIPGRCPQINCPENWKPCNSADICVPYYRFCDGDADCPNGEDELNCQTNRTIRLVRGKNVNQGFVEYRINGTWNGICYEQEFIPASIANAIVACRQLGYKGTARDSFRTAAPRYIISSIKGLSCNGKETLISQCSMEYCQQCYCQHYFSVDCSNNHCLSDQVPCPGENGKPYTNSSACIWKHNLCDGEYDCPGGTDEQNCKDCNTSEFRCRNKECIPLMQRCNGVPDCQDSSDEHECFKQNITGVLLMQNGKYEALCENNINNQQIANVLCKALGRGNGTVLPSSQTGPGIQFNVSSNSTVGILTGFHPNAVPSCKLLNLVCNLKNCGQRALWSTFEPTIRYGIFSLPGEWPWQVALIRNLNFICGGTLISQRYVLTAAHCVSKKSFFYTVKVGSINRKSGQSYNVKKIISHPGFDFTFYKHDVALLELSSEVKLNNFVQIACLPSHPAVPNSQCFTTGWGVDENEVYNNYLKEAKVRILTSEICKSYYANAENVALCANHPEPYQPACFGDSGGPLQCLNEYGHWNVVGVTSYGQPQCTRKIDAPEAYADVYVHLDWIMKNAPNLYQ